MKRTIKSFFLVAVACALMATNALAFTVVEGGDITEINAPHEWAKAEIELAREAGLLTEHTDNYFKEDITRFQFAELAVNLAEKATGKEITAAPADTFTDCTETAVLKAYAAGIVNGVGNGAFAPDQTTNREQIAAMLYRAVQYIEQNGGKSLDVKSADISKYTDNAQVSSWAKDAVGALAANGVMKGTSDTTLSPQASCTVEQSVLLVYRLYGLVK